MAVRTSDSVSAFYSRLLDRLGATPGVQAVAAMSGLPPLRRVNANDTSIEGYKAPPEGPFRLVVVGDKRPARSARQVTSVTLLRLPTGP